MEDQRIEILNRIQRLNQEDDVGNTKTIQDLKQEYNLIVERVYCDSPAEFWDIIEFFPPEIWIRIIQESLPEQNYPSALLNLTMVSTKWQHAIISTPILWAHIQICELDEDLFSTIEVFTHLSRNVDLDITIYQPFYLEAEIVDSILGNMRSRLHRIAILGPEGFVEDPANITHYLNPESRAETRVVLGSFKNISSNAHIYSQQSNTPLGHRNTLITLNVMTLSSRLESMHDWWFDYRRVARGQSFQHLEAFKSPKSPEDAFEWFLFHSPNIGNLGIIESEIDERKSLKHTRVALSNLTKLCLTQEHRRLPMTLLSGITPQLFALELKMPHSQYSNVFEILSSATRLTKLSLTLCRDKPGDESARPAQAAKMRISSLRELFLCFDWGSYGTSERQTQVQLLTDFCTLYPDVDDAFFFFWVDSKRGGAPLPQIPIPSSGFEVAQGILGGRS